MTSACSRTLLIAAALSFLFSVGIAHAQQVAGSSEAMGGEADAIAGNPGLAAARAESPTAGSADRPDLRRYTEVECDWYRRFFPTRLPPPCAPVVRR